MVGRSHLLVGLTGGVIFDSITSVSGPHLIGTGTITLTTIIDKVIFYCMVALGALLPDIDNARSTLGKRIKWVSRGIQHTFGHRTLFHSILGLAIGSGLALGIEQLIRYLLVSRGYVPSAESLARTHMILIAVLFGSIMHILADSLTTEGVPLFWPIHKYVGFPPVRDWRFTTGTWPEYVIVYGFMIASAVALYYGVITI